MELHLFIMNRVMVIIVEFVMLSCLSGIASFSISVMPATIAASEYSF